MKRLLLSAALAAGSLTAARAQESRFGVKAGGSLTTYVGQDVNESSRSKAGFHGGLVASLGLTERLSLQPELLYSMKGIQDESNAPGLNIKGSQTLYYADVPVLAKLRFNRLFLEAGPQIGVLVAAKGTVESGTTRLVQANKRSFNDLDVGYALGAGFQAAGGLMAGLRYNGGLRNVIKPVTGSGGITAQPEGRNSALQLYVGFLFAGK